MDNVFSAGNMLAMIGWLILLFSPWFPVWADRIAGYIFPLVLSVAYLVLVLVYFAGLEGGFTSLDDVVTLFSQPTAVVTGWLHYLAFDLFVGAWEVRQARRTGMRFIWVVPCLVLTWLFGPVGLLLFLTLSLLQKRVLQPPEPVA